MDRTVQGRTAKAEMDRTVQGRTAKAELDRIGQYKAEQPRQKWTG